MTPVLDRARARIAGGLRAGLALLLLAGPPAAAGQAPEAPVTTLDGVFTAEQAARGRATYVRVCSQCHALDWYRGDVVRAWEGAPLYGLFDVISTTMPQDNPGSLPRRAYVDMLAYILELNGMPAGGEELPTGASPLRRILFRWSDDR